MMLFISFMAKVRSLSTVRCAECTNYTVFRNSLPVIEKNERAKTYFTFLEKKRYFSWASSERTRRGSLNDTRPSNE